MTKSINLRALFGVATLLLLGTALGRADGSGIRDNATLFSDAAKSEASRNITELEKRFGKDLAIETFKAIPDDLKKGVDLQDKAAMNRLFEQWAVKQAKQLKVNGVYVLISTEPAHLQIVLGTETQKKAFTLLDRDNLISTMLGRLRQKQNDQALLEGVNFVHSTIRAHASVRAPARSMAPMPAPAVTSHAESSETSRPWLWILLALLGVGAVLLIMGIFRAMTRGGGTPGVAGASPLSGGGGFMSSLLGGMFGAAAGMWLYNQFSGNHGSAWGADQNSNNDGGGDNTFSGRDSDYSSSGGDFSDSSSGGGDSGGGDSGGGGGGDF